jgi:uncharacterized protein (DUF4415 family)
MSDGGGADGVRDWLTQANAGVQMNGERRRRPVDSRQAAEAAFKTATTKPLDPVPERPSIPNAKELVSLRIDRDVLEHFQESGPGWQDRINEALRRIAGK